jgi:hypothetical protein
MKSAFGDRLSANIRLWKEAVAQAEKDDVIQALVGLPVEGGRSW